MLPVLLLGEACVSAGEAGIWNTREPALPGAEEDGVLVLRDWKEIRIYFVNTLECELRMPIAATTKLHLVYATSFGICKGTVAEVDKALIIVLIAYLPIIGVKHEQYRFE